MCRRVLYSFMVIVPFVMSAKAPAHPILLEASVSGGRKAVTRCEEAELFRGRAISE